MATPVIWFDASFGGIDLLIAELDSDIGRNIAIKSPSRGNKHTLFDRGAQLLRTSVTILFIDQPGADAYTTRFDAFRALISRDDNADIFSHPLLGSYRARIGEATAKSNADEGMISVQCVVLAEDEPQTVSTPGAGVSPDAGAAAVAVAAQLAYVSFADLEDVTFDQLEPVDFTSTKAVVAAASAAATTWAETDPDELDTNAVTAQLNTITGQLSAKIDELDLATDLERWPAYRAIIGVSYQLRRAAEAATSSSANLLNVTVTVPEPLRSICARIYGPGKAEDLQRQVAKLNRIERPGLVPRGTYKFPSQGASP